MNITLQPVSTSSQKGDAISEVLLLIWLYMYVNGVLIGPALAIITFFLTVVEDAVAVLKPGAEPYSCVKPSLL